jgi:DNA mismatch repair protein MutL
VTVPIQVLAPEVAQKIAAGEVVERPASVVKELVENALDAGARQVQVEIRGGGLQSIKVADDGDGIPSAEVELAFLRHATSKLRQADDLSAIQTLGFRGEALASIAAVAQVVIYTRHRVETTGVCVTLEAGQVVERKPWAGAVGTTILVRHLFFNVPARLKFLRSATAEAGQIGHALEHFALGHPEVRFRLVNEGRRTLETPGSGDLRDAVRQVYGAPVAEGMLPIDQTVAEIRLGVVGLIGRTEQTRATRAGLGFFVNGRRVSNPSLSYAVEEAYRPALLPGRHPVVVLHLSLPPADVDCNVHPTKAEVRLVHERAVHAAVYQAIRAALLEVAPVPEVGGALAPAAWAAPGDWWESATAAPPRPVPAVDAPRWGPAIGPTLGPGDAAAPAMAPARVDAVPPSAFLSPEGGEAIAAPAPPGALDEPFRPTRLRPIGQVQNTYIVAEGPGGVYFIDQHTAHERILYEEVVAQRSAPGAPAQALLAPVVIPLSAEQRASLAERGEALRHFGFQFEEFGPAGVALRAVPPRWARADLARAFRDAVDTLAGETVGADGTDRLAATIACHSAVRAGDPLTREEMAALLARLEQTDVGRYCPHGRPIVVHLSAAQLEKDFHRR